MNDSSPHSRFFFFGLALLLAVGVAVLGGTSFQRKIESFQPLGFECELAQGAWVVTALSDGSSALRPGDEILLIHGETAAEGQRLRELLRSRPSGELLVKRGEALETIPYARPRLAIDVSYLILTAFGVVYLLIGLYTAFKDRHLRAKLFYLWCLSSAAVYILSSPAPRDLTDTVIFLVDQLARTLLPVLTLHLFLVFPTHLVERSRLGRALPVLYLPAVMLIGFHVDQIFLGGRIFGAPSPAALVRVGRLELYLLVFFSLLAVLALAVHLVKRPVWEQRRQVQWIMIGMLGGYAPFLLFYLIPLSLGLGWPSWTTSAAVLPLGLVPLAFAWAILKYKLWDIGLILRNSISYSLTVLVGLCGFSLINLAIQRGLAEDLATLRNFLTFAAGLAIAGVLVPTRGVISSGLERLQYRGTLAHRRALTDLGHELLFERDLGRLCELLIDRLTEGLMAHANLCVVRGDTVSVALAPVRPIPDGPSEISFEALGPGFWDRDVTGVSAIALPVEEMTAEQRLFAAGYRYAFPLVVRNHRVGIALVSYKYDGEPLNSEDLDLTRGLLNQTALAIENAQLLEEVNRRLQEVVSLEERAKGIIESSPAGIAVLDFDERVVSANHAFAAIAELPQSETIGRRIEELLPVHPLPDPAEGLIEVSYSELSGREHNLQLSVARYRQRDGSPLRVLIVQDTSDRIAMETALKEKERLASLGMLAAGVAHEVNTPLTGISSYTQLLLAELAEDDPHYEILKKVERQSFRAAQIVNNLLDFSRNRREEFSPVNIEPVVGECVRMLDDRAAEAGVSVFWDHSTTDEALLVLGHESELSQVFTNLMVNALDAVTGSASTAAGGRLAVTVEAADGRLRTRISDTGPGIPPERIERIFQPFFSSKLNKGGTGLGLAIAYNIVRRHRGTLSVANNTDERGCTFTVDLPHYKAR